MKIIVIISILTLCFTCKAQSPIFPLDDWYNEQPNAYYKDIQNELDTFTGTWLYTNGSTSWRIVLNIEEMFFNETYYEDLITGEYQYIEDGIEIINTLEGLNTLQGDYHEIYGNGIFKGCDYLPPSDCIDDEIRLRVTMIDPLTGHVASVFLHKRVVNGQEAILAYVIFNQLVSYNGFSKPKPEPNMPWQQEYVLIKQ